SGKTFSDAVAQVIASLPTLQTNHIVSPIADIETVHTNIITPISNDPHIALSFKDNHIAVLNGSDKDSTSVATVDNKGNATFAGTVSAQNASISGQLTVATIQSQDATVSGTLHAGHIIADSI